MSGLDAELAFEQACIKRDWKYRKATETEDREQHWDYLVERRKPIKVEVKAAKRLKRSDPFPSQIYTWLEIQGVPRPDGTPNAGWLHGQADWIAFQTGKGFLMVQRVQALALALKWASLAKRCQDFKKAPLHQIYDRVTAGLPRGSMVLVLIQELASLENSFLLE